MKVTEQQRTQIHNFMDTLSREEIIDELIHVLSEKAVLDILQQQEEFEAEQEN
jgi:mannitol/fructose-specific phosphotransferase system IIA component (Ntr-type)